MKLKSKLYKKRRRQHKTDYHRRLILLKGNFPRLVIRKTNKYLILQIVESKNAQDKICFSANTKELLKKGWPEENKGSLKSVTAAYLTGFLLGKKANLNKKIILDSGLIPSTAGSKIYAAVKGLVDSGIEISYNEKMFPSQERLEGKDTKISLELFKKIKEGIN